MPPFFSKTAFREVPDSCLQFWGGMGFTKDVYVSRLYRDLRLVSIGGGVDEVMLGIICKIMGTLPKAQKRRKQRDEENSQKQEASHEIRQ